jgi:hypothetical protein
MKHSEISPADKLEALRRKSAKQKKSFRISKYENAQGTMQSVLEMRSDSDALMEFIERYDMTSEKLKGKNNSWITSTAFTFVFGEKLGWKCARAAEFLYDFKKVPIDQLAEQIRKLGGFEKIVRLAAKEDPRRAAPPATAKKKLESNSEKKNSAFKSANVKETQSSDDDDWDPPTPRNVSKRPPDEDNQIIVRMSPELHAKFMATKAGRRVKLVGPRIDNVWFDAVLDVEKLRLLKD